MIRCYGGEAICKQFAGQQNVNGLPALTTKQSIETVLKIKIG